MSRASVFWLLMILWLVFSLWFSWPAVGGTYIVLGGPVLIFVLFALVGWQLFGPPIKN